MRRNCSYKRSLSCGVPAGLGAARCRFGGRGRTGESLADALPDLLRRIAHLGGRWRSIATMRRTMGLAVSLCCGWRRAVLLAVVLPAADGCAEKRAARR